jgi:hypothetical protein
MRIAGALFLSVLTAALASVANAVHAAEGPDLRKACFAYVEKRLAKAPVKDVPWSNNQKMSFDGIDMKKETLRSNFSGMSVDLKWKTIDTSLLINLVRAAAGPDDSFDPEGYLLAAVLLASDERRDNAQALLDKINARDVSYQAKFDEWAKALGLGAPTKVLQPAAPSESGTATTSAPPSSTPASSQKVTRKAVAKEHPRLLGNRQRLQALALERPVPYKAMEDVARKLDAGDNVKIPAMALVACIQNDAALGKLAVQKVMPLVNGPIRTGHVTFGHDLAMCALVYDLCFESWTPAERAKFIEYYNKTVDANVNSETSPFHNGYYGYKNWGIGLGAYATMHENPRAPEILKNLENDFRARAVPCLEHAGDGGGWAEGHYIAYWQYSWLFFCEVARICEGVDYYAMAPKFFGHRAVAAIFEMMPGREPMELNRMIPMGDGGYGAYQGFSDIAHISRRILCSYYRNDPAHQAVQAYNMQFPYCTIPDYAYMDFLWNDQTVPRGDLKSFKLSHYSPGPGYVYARSSWEGDATYLFFNCGDRFTSHEHLDVGHFIISRADMLAGDGGVYDSFNSDHCANYYLRSIAHNTMLVHDPSEKIGDGIRAAGKSANDGGQHYHWLGNVSHNAGVNDEDDWKKHQKFMDIADMLAFDDQKSYVYAAGDCSRAYAPAKLDFFTRQIVFIRPNTFVIFDRVQSKNPNFKKTWLLQAMSVPTGSAPNLSFTHGKSKLFIQTLLPADPAVKLNSNGSLYSYGGATFKPDSAPSGPVPQCRIEISPKTAATFDCFLHVLTATDAATASVPQATMKNGSEITVTIGNATLKFHTTSVGGSVEIGGQRGSLAKNLN